ncbi:glycerophosphocholine cholinephosphodiesterase ENPP6-like [Panulirus ornatus]|uniref:glycerophosphocholine cholinephosphodiesterase ENPP6-like n=1 Tax=Panulirus ornatus TaxID=150431 RepID=UPI003A899C96
MIVAADVGGMWRGRVVSVLLLWGCVGVWSAPPTPVASPLPTPDMILIMIDGFRWDYLDLHRGDGLPGFERMITKGVSAKHLNPVFPADSFPNWRTIVTGLYAENHGIVGNFMYDLEHKKAFSLFELESTADPVWWTDAEPLWITATKNNKDTALFHWSRCDVPWEGVLPKYCVPYEEIGPTPRYFINHLHQALDMIQHEGYQLVMVYEGAVDIQGHNYGPASGEVDAVIREVDSGLQGLWDALAIRGMMNTTNVVLVSDHGMTETSSDDFHYLDVTPCLDDQQILGAVKGSGYLNIEPTPGYSEQVIESLRNCPGVGDKIDVYRKKDLPEVYHYKTHRLILELIVIAKEGYIIRNLDLRNAMPHGSSEVPGNHGFDNIQGQNPDMHGILYAIGPSFVKGVEVGAMEQVDVYGLLCHALDLPCHAHNGSEARVQAFFNPITSGVTRMESCHLQMIILLAYVLSLWQVLLR